MNEKFEIRLIRNAARGMRECADTLDRILADLTGAETAPKGETAEKPVTLEDVRGLLADKSRAGHTAEVKAMLIKHGADRLSGIDPANYAALMADAHNLCEYKLRKALGENVKDPTENLEFYDSEMERCAEDYAAYVLELVEKVRAVCPDPVVLVEQRLDYSRFVESGFGTGDCVVIGDGTLHVVDYKHGKGVEVSAEKNPQMMCYALGALELFDGIYDIDTVTMTIFQPRRENVSVFTMTKADLYSWAENVLAPTAKLAYAGEGEFSAGEHCRCINVNKVDKKMRKN